MKVTDIWNSIYGFLKDLAIGGAIFLAFAILCLIAYLVVTYIPEGVLLILVVMFLATILGHQIRTHL